VGNTLPDRSK